MYEKTKWKIQKMMKKGVFSGASFCFIEGEKEESNCWGLAQIKPTKEQLTSAMLFDVASLTKVVGTTTVILQLVEEGKIILDQSLQTYYPSFQDSNITIRHLLTHTADLQGYIPNRDQLNAQELKDAYNHSFHVGKAIGKKVVYTDAGTILLGFMLEEMFQQSMIEILSERVLLPLGMNESTFLPKNPLNCVPTELHEQRGLIRGTTHDPKAFVLREHAGNAGLFSNVYDLTKFVRMYLNRGSYHNHQFLKKETIDLLLVNQVPAADKPRSLGWDFKYDVATQRPLLFHTGYTGTFLLIDVRQQSAFIFLSNRVHPEDHRNTYIEERDQLLATYLKEKSSVSDEMTSF
ncbi:TPA: beta-lactamase family protein [Enterococcus faecalis]|uniref:serine hydrolase domain-containing protein n=1 Tax=Enterococcus TaxID=1350 RepID=UPI0015713659|nr:MULTISPECIES: serine hydrolase domain-containing protein [Enterococcus]EGO8393964.1 class A beta-lactamase-related serine hydrolase [Enterococcus faecalis]EGO9009272.1 class A beta-lactamase-related serine hydrolase [Enterococcus faecalis]EGO9444472.1 class A beta-lactamase-related serine hydrolase [Enterococcus faecalis]EHZ9203611.1 beta-lactamase family protein [Enterococcus faecalis]EJC3746903.1 beta-lactamase family protein [Enterococcus faecalis]